MASLGWIDFSPSYRSKVATILDLLRAEGVVDELGIGTIRDALSDQMFPGISTIQTRARYFFLVPYILRDYSRLPYNQREKIKVERYLIDKENEVMWDLGDYYNHLEGYGVIGITKRKEKRETLARKPSEIYWGGINKFQFIKNNDLAITPFLRNSSKNILESLLSDIPGDDIQKDDAGAEWMNIFKISLTENLDWRKELEKQKLDLTRNESESFRDRIIQYAPDSLLSQLLLDEGLFELYLNSPRFMNFAKSVCKDNFPVPPVIYKQILLGHDFSVLLFGAHLLYNHLLQSKLGNEDFLEEWEEWKVTFKNEMIDFANFDLNSLFLFALSSKMFTKNFVKEWYSELSKENPSDEKLTRMVEIQEIMNKKGKARLNKNMLEDVEIGKWTGLQYLDYRFFQARRILSDIKEGLK